jgi:hypothetical protein
VTWSKTIEKAGDGRVPIAGDVVSLHVRLWSKGGTGTRAAPIIDTYSLAQPIIAVVGSGYLHPNFEALLNDVPAGTTFWIDPPIPEKLGPLGLGGGAVCEVHIADVRPADGMIQLPPAEYHFGPCSVLDDLERLRLLRAAIARFGNDNRGFITAKISRGDFAGVAAVSRILSLQIEQPVFVADVAMIRLLAPDVERMSTFLDKAIEHLEGL